MKSLLAFCVLSTASAANAQDLYSPTVLRTVDLTFAQSDWQQQLQANYFPQIEIPVDLTMEGVTYPNVGVRIRGNTSFTGLPLGSQKFSLNLSLDFQIPDQDLLGYSSLNFNNAHRDPTFVREVVFNNFAARYVPNARSNHILLRINGEDWGVYANVQQFNKDMLRDYFADEDGMRVKIGNPPIAPGLQYFGTDPASYDAYEIKNDGGLANPVAEIIALCDAVSGGDLANWHTIDERLAVDPSIWSACIETLFSDEDGYVNEGKDFVMYRDPVDSRTHLLLADGNESWMDPAWSPTRSFGDSTKPFLSHVLSAPELRQRYMAHMRTLLRDFDWQELEPTVLAHRDLIGPAVLADPKKIYTHQDFLDGYGTGDVDLGAGPFGGTIPGLQRFAEERRALLMADPEVAAVAPSIAWVHTNIASPMPSDIVIVTALIDEPAAGVAGADLWFRGDVSAPFMRTPMRDDGMTGDGLAGDGVWGARLPVLANAGQTVPYYVSSAAANSYGSLSFSPDRAELDPLEIDYAPGSSGLRITEYMYSGDGDEFFELTNTSSAAIDVTGWSMDDSSQKPGVFDLSAAGMIQPGESIIVCENDAAAFAADWALTGVTVLGLNVDANLGRNDEIHVYDASHQEVARLAYGDDDFEGTHRARRTSAQACTEALGAPASWLWSASAVGDAFGSLAATSGDVGTPGSSTPVPCASPGAAYCMAEVNSTMAAATIEATGTALVAANDVTLRVTSLPQQTFGIFVSSQAQGFVPGIGGSQGNLCVVGSIGRHQRPGEVMNSAVTGEVSLALDLGDLPSPFGSVAVLAGEAWNFQFWFRDTNPVATSNYSNGYAITFE